MGLEKLIKDVEREFPPNRFQWVLSRNHDGRYFANIFPAEFREVGKGPDISARHVSSPQSCLRAAFANALQHGVGARLHGKRDS